MLIWKYLQIILFNNKIKIQSKMYNMITFVWKREKISNFLPLLIFVILVILEFAYICVKIPLRRHQRIQKGGRGTCGGELAGGRWGKGAGARRFAVYLLILVWFLYLGQYFAQFKNSVGGLSSRLNTAKARISELQQRTGENNGNSVQRQKVANTSHSHSRRPTGRMRETGHMKG